MLIFKKNSLHTYMFIPNKNDIPTTSKLYFDKNNYLAFSLWRMFVVITGFSGVSSNGGKILLQELHFRGCRVSVTSSRRDPSSRMQVSSRREDFIQKTTDCGTQRSELP